MGIYGTALGVSVLNDGYSFCYEFEYHSIENK
jgi:hypothetical protein